MRTRFSGFRASSAVRVCLKILILMCALALHSASLVSAQIPFAAERHSLAPISFGESIFLSIDLRSPDLSKIHWLDRERMETFTIWTNIGLGHMPAYGAFWQAGHSYDYRALILLAGQGESLFRIVADERSDGSRIFTLQPDRPPEKLSRRFFEYMVDPPANAEVPTALYEQMDVFLIHAAEQLPASSLQSGMRQRSRWYDRGNTSATESSRISLESDEQLSSPVAETETASISMNSMASTDPVHDFFNGVYVGSGWYYSSWFGYYSPDSQGYVFHNTFGWLSVALITDGTMTGAWIYGEQLKWMYVFKPADPSTAGGFTLSFDGMPSGFKSTFYQSSNNQVRWFLLWDQGYWVSIPDTDPATQPDFDVDGLGDWWEMDYFGDLTRDDEGDFDGDGIKDIDEFLAGLNPTQNSDLDSDGLPDDWETFYGAYSAGADNDGDGWTNLEEYTGGDDPNEINNTLAPPTFQVRGDYTQLGSNYTVEDGGELSLYLHSAAPAGTTHYLVAAPHLSPYLRFDGTFTSPRNLNADADTYDPKAASAAILKINNGEYTIRAKTYLEVDGNQYESAEVEFTFYVEPLPRTGLPSGVKYITTAYYDPETEYFYDFAFDVPEHRLRFTCPGWLIEPESTFSPDYWVGFIPDLTSSSSPVYAGYRKPKVFSENSISIFWGNEVVVNYGRGWAAGDQLYCDFSSSFSKKRYYGDSKQGWISDDRNDVNDLWEEDLYNGWMTTDGFIPDQSTTIYTDDIYFDDERGRLTTSPPPRTR